MSIDDLAWFKSSYSSGGDGDCVEVAIARREPTVAEAVHVRDSKDRHGPRLTLSLAAWHRFVSYAARA
ncbi:DUF397 domain-containing protein [Streptomyces thermoalcalitolerans]|uniref:DUF397 domain-containing protein n=1 Tax=Streptomyces thermoalcalitolerans TaxID=65605 RepID=A0ABN1NN85_9ACTN